MLEGIHGEILAERAADTLRGRGIPANRRQPLERIGDLGMHGHQRHADPVAFL